MPTTPLDADAEMRVSYHAAGIDHKINLKVSIVEPYTIGVAPTILAFSGSADNVDSDALMTAISVAAKPMFKAADHFIGYEIWDMQTDPPTWIFAGADSTAGTHTGADSQRAEAEQMFTFMDAAGKKVKHAWFGGVTGTIARVTDVTGTEFQDWGFGMLDQSGSSIGNFIQGRSANHILRLMSVSIQANNALERKIKYG